MHSILATGSPAAAGGLHGCLHGCLAAGAGAAAGLPDGRAYAVATLASWLVTWWAGPLDRAGLEKASCECYAIVKERFDAFLTPPSTAVQGRGEGRNRQADNEIG